MNNKGFTMIELLATLIILSVITGFATYGVIRTISTSKLKSEKIFVGELEDSVQGYLAYYGNSLHKKDSGISGTITKCKRTTESSNCQDQQVDIWELDSINFDNITNASLKTIKKEDVVNPKTKQNCLDNKNPTIRVFKDADFVYYYYIDLSGDNTSCDITNTNAIVTNLPANISQNLG